MRPFIFLSGEFSVTQPAVFHRDLWSHTTIAKRLIYDDCLHRDGIHEDIKGLIYYARTTDFEIEVHNLNLIERLDTPCWPQVHILQAMSDRHAVLQQCVELGLVTHHVCFSDKPVDFPFPYVIKVGQEHCGIGKYLVREPSEIPQWEGIATIEPFFQGTSVRVLLIGGTHFGISIKNTKSWIANSEGAEVEIFDPPDSLVAHARRVATIFGLEIAGVDYIMDDRPHFLEINQFPGLNVSDEAVACARAFLDAKMEEVEVLHFG